MESKRVVVYFNHWFSSTVHIIEDMKARHGEEVYIIASSNNKDITYKKSADKFIDETKIRDNYGNSIDMYYDICLNNSVDIFFCRDKGNKFTKESIKKFDNIGTKVVLDINDNLNDKVLFYEELKKIEKAEQLKLEQSGKLEKSSILKTGIQIPNFISTRNLVEVEAKELICREIDNSVMNNTPMIFKKAIDEGGSSYREIETASKLSYETLSYYRTNKVSSNEAKELINSLTKEQIDSLLFMEKLGTPEISIDCYNSAQGFIGVLREKSGRVQKLTAYSGERVMRNKLVTYAKIVAEQFNIKYPFNIQFMSDIKTKEPKILEINLRLSGGAYLLAYAGINLADICLIDNTEKILWDYNIGNKEYNRETKIIRVEGAIIA